MSHSSTATGGLTRRTPNPWYVAVVSGMASYIDAAAIVSSGIALVLYQHSSVGITGDQIGILSAALTLGIACGALVGGRLGDRYGRRRVFMITMALVVIGSAMEVFAGSFAPLLIGSALAGFATGADLPVSISTIAEVGTDKNRGKLVGSPRCCGVSASSPPSGCRPWSVISGASAARSCSPTSVWSP